MTKNSKTISVAVASLLSMGIAAANTAWAADKDDAEQNMEKCFGVAKAGKNDCAANGHACAGQSKRDSDPGEWITLPAGTCERLLNGRAEPKE